jgi:hypothetical protein
MEFKTFHYSDNILFRLINHNMINIKVGVPINDNLGSEWDFALQRKNDFFSKSFSIANNTIITDLDLSDEEKEYIFFQISTLFQYLKKDKDLRLRILPALDDHSRKLWETY